MLQIQTVTPRFAHIKPNWNSFYILFSSCKWGFFYETYHHFVYLLHPMMNIIGRAKMKRGGKGETECDKRRLLSNNGNPCRKSRANTISITLSECYRLSVETKLVWPTNGTRGVNKVRQLHRTKWDNRLLPGPDTVMRFRIRKWINSVSSEEIVSGNLQEIIRKRDRERVGVGKGIWGRHGSISKICFMNQKATC